MVGPGQRVFQAEVTVFVIFDTKKPDWQLIQTSFFSDSRQTMKETQADHRNLQSFGFFKVINHVQFYTLKYLICFEQLPGKMSRSSCCNRQRRCKESKLVPSHTAIITWPMERTQSNTLTLFLLLTISNQDDEMKWNQMRCIDFAIICEHIERICELWRKSHGSCFISKPYIDVNKSHF